MAIIPKKYSEEEIESTRSSGVWDSIKELRKQAEGVFTNAFNAVLASVTQFRELPKISPESKEVVEKDVIIQEKEKLYMELKNLLARQPGPEVAEQLSIQYPNLHLVFFPTNTTIEVDHEILYRYRRCQRDQASPCHGCFGWCDHQSLSDC